MLPIANSFDNSSTLVSGPHPVENTEFMKHSGIKHFQIGMPGNKEPFVNSKLAHMSVARYKSARGLTMDLQFPMTKYPLLCRSSWIGETIQS